MWCPSAAARLQPKPGTPRQALQAITRLSDMKNKENPQITPIKELFFFLPFQSSALMSNSVHVPGQTSASLCCELPGAEGLLWFGILCSICLLQRSGFQLFPAPNHRDAMFTLTALLLCSAHRRSQLSPARENKDKLTHDLKVMNLHSFLSSAPSFKSLQIVVRINFHGALPHLPVDVQAVANIINLAAFKGRC